MLAFWFPKKSVNNHPLPRRRLEGERGSDGEAVKLRAELVKARGYIRELSHAGAALEDRFLALQQDKAEVGQLLPA